MASPQERTTRRIPASTPLFGEYRHPSAPDPIIGLASIYEADKRPGKINMAIGVVRDERGRIYVPSAIRKASKMAARIHDGYVLPSAPVGWNGDIPFMTGLAELIYADQTPQLLAENRIAAASTVGGTQAVAIFADSLAKSAKDQGKPLPTVVMGHPAYPNHPSLFQERGIRVEYYSQTRDEEFNMAAFLNKIKFTKQGSVFLFQGTAHNPTGINARTPEEWEQIADALKSRGHTAFFDFAYAGFDGPVTKDTEPARIVMSKDVPTAVAFSVSKTMGLYGERVGALYVAGPSQKYAVDTTSMFNEIIRGINSSPPGNGQRIAGTALGDEKLRRQWEDETAKMAAILKARRDILAAALPDNVGNFVRAGEGIFTVLPIRPEGVQFLREQKGVYVVPNGPKQIRINIGGATIAQTRIAATAIREAYDKYAA